MAELQFSSFFGTYGGAADDSTDCKAALDAAIVAMRATSGGTLVFPSGICRMNSEVSANLAGDEGIYHFKGSGGSQIRFQGIDYNRLVLNSTENIIFEDLIFRGNTAVGAPFHEATNAIFLFSGVNTVSFKNCIIAAMGTGGSGGNNYGVIAVTGSQLEMENCKMAGIFGPAAVRGHNSIGVVLKHVFFPDYTNINGAYVSKTPVGASTWVKMTEDSYEVAPTAPQEQAGKTSRLKLIHCGFDEGATNAVYTDGIRYIETEGCPNNYGKWVVKNAKSFIDRNSFFGYGTTLQDAVTLENVDYAEMTGSVLDRGMSTVKLLGTTKRAVFNGVQVPQNPGVIDRLHKPMEFANVINTAGAYVEIDGVKKRGSGPIQIG